jgi:methylaspartate ammonia-lyase
LFLSGDYIPFLENHVKPLLEGMELTSFRDMAKMFAELLVEGRGLHTAIRYGLTQALLDARAKSLNLLACEVVCAEYNLPLIAQRVPIFGQTGDSRYENVDKMIIKGVEALPHGLINNIDEKLGRHGEKLVEYIDWLVERVQKLRREPAYRPSLHIDVYGNIGPVFNNNTDKIVDYLASLEEHAKDLPLYIEGPVDMEDKQLQIEKLASITGKLHQIGSNVKTVADEWCNTFEDIKDFCDARACDMVQIKTPDLGGIQNIIESILYCQRSEVEAYQGGSCNETDVSARLCVHLALAARADRMLAKPGMGFDEGFTIVNNELERIIAVLRMKTE